MRLFLYKKGRGRQSAISGELVGTGRKKYQLFLRLEAQQQQSSNVITQLEIDGNLVNKNSYILKEILFIKNYMLQNAKIVLLNILMISKQPGNYLLKKIYYVKKN